MCSTPHGATTTARAHSTQRLRRSRSSSPVRNPIASPPSFKSLRASACVVSSSLRHRPALVRAQGKSCFHTHAHAHAHTRARAHTHRARAALRVHQDGPDAPPPCRRWQGDEEASAASQQGNAPLHTLSSSSRCDARMRTEAFLETVWLQGASRVGLSAGGGVQVGA